jgi:GDP-mannose 6-dehydrogenase
VRALTYKARTLDLDVPVLNAILPSNARQIERGLRMICAKPGRRIGILGFSFKAGTDDLRESPMVEVIERLIGKGYDVKIYDRNVRLASLMGANRDYLLNHIPHIAKLMTGEPDDVLRHAETLVIGNADPEFRAVLAKAGPSQQIVDFMRLDPAVRSGGSYDGICW